MLSPFQVIFFLLRKSNLIKNLMLTMKEKLKMNKIVNNLIKKIFKLKKRENKILKRNSYKTTYKIPISLPNKWKIHQWKWTNLLNLLNNHTLIKLLKLRAKTYLIMHVLNVNNGHVLQMIVFLLTKIQPWVWSKVTLEIAI